MFIDETWTATNMTRSHGRCARGERLRMGYPHGHRKTTTLVAGANRCGLVTPLSASVLLTKKPPLFSQSQLITRSSSVASYNDKARSNGFEMPLAEPVSGDSAHL